MDALETAGRPAWFRLGDRDLAMCLIRTEVLHAGRPLTEAHAAVVDVLGVAARMLPMADEPVSTRVLHGGRWLPFQEYMIVHRAAPPVEGVEIEGVEAARPTDAVLAALADAELIVIGPSNPVISIGPILALAGMSAALRDAPAPVVAVSPFVGGRTLKGPTDDFCRYAGIETNAAGIARAYGDVLDGIVADEEAPGIDCLVTDTLMGSPERCVALATNTLDFAVKLAG
jgi:LPPG:FO 2-phospho-L-lactate transferase